MLTFRDFLHERKNKITQTKARERAEQCGLEIIFKIFGFVSIVSNVSKVRSGKYIRLTLKKK